MALWMLSEATRDDRVQLSMCHPICIVFFLVASKTTNLVEALKEDGVDR
jgi:hypothetical protein